MDATTEPQDPSEKDTTEPSVFKTVEALTKGIETAWPAVALQLRRLVNTGGGVLVHCRGGLGRAGTFAACLLVELGEAPREAVLRVRATRPNAIETAPQERHVLHHRPPPA